MVDIYPLDNYIYFLTDPVQPGLFYKHLRYSFVNILRALFLQTFITSLHPNRESQRAKILRECSPSTTCHMSGVRCQVSRVTCLFFFFFFFFFGQKVGASRWRVCYQRGLPRLVFNPEQIRIIFIILVYYQYEYEYYLYFFLL